MFFSELLSSSFLQLVVAAFDSDINKKQQLHVAVVATNNVEEPPPLPPSSSPLDCKSILIFLKMLGTNKSGFSLEVEVTYTIRKLKEMIEEADDILLGITAKAKQPKTLSTWDQFRSESTSIRLRAPSCSLILTPFPWLSPMDDSSSCLQAVQSRAAEKDSRSDEGAGTEFGFPREVPAKSSPPSVWNAGLVVVDCRTIFTDDERQAIASWL
nr:hypothetical protein Iba_chr09aCG13580 [Ipomoea batatas]